MFTLLCVLFTWTLIHAQVPCPRFADGSNFIQPKTIYSKKGFLDVYLTYESRIDENGLSLFCFMMADGVNQSPTLRVNPGDTILLTVFNNYPGLGNDTTDDATTSKIVSKVTCGAKNMTSSSVNIHFHGIHGSPQCHEDEVLETLINYKDIFTYQITIPLDQQPGLYWYHPHVHGLSEASLLGGSAGAIIVEGLENMHKGLAGLPEQVMVFRDHGVIDNITALYPNINGSIYDLSLNYITISLPESIPPVLRIQPSEKQLWRIVNAGADAILLLKLMYDNIEVPFDVIAVDGDIGTNINQVTEFLLPPGKRVQIVVTGPSVGVQRAVLATQYVWTGNNGDLDPTRDLLLLIPDVNAANSEFMLQVDLTSGVQDDLVNEKAEVSMVKYLISAPVDQVRVLYFSELPDNETFYITEVGKPLIAYSRDVAPALTSYSGTVEKWVIQNRAEELHVFHIHQIHFLAVAVNGMPLVEPIFRDVLEIPTWSGRASDPYPNMTILLDFRSPLIVGQFPYHCHILGHEDKGMMAKIEVLPGKQAVAVTNAPQVSSTVTNSNSNSLFLVVVTVLPICGCIILGLLAYILYSRIEVVKTVDKKKYHYSQKDENHFTSIDKSHESSNDLESANASDCFTESGLKTDRIVDLTMNIDGSKRSVALSTTRDDTWTEVGNDTVPTAATTSNHSVLVEYEMVNRSVSRSQLTASLDYAHFGINGGEVPNVYEE